MQEGVFNLHLETDNPYVNLETESTTTSSLMHLQEELIPKLKQGQPVLGEFKKGQEGKKGKASGKKGDNKKDGDGSESQEQNWEFHELRPSDFQGKPVD